MTGINIRLRFVITSCTLSPQAAEISVIAYGIASAAMKSGLLKIEFEEGITLNTTENAERNVRSIQLRLEKVAMSIKKIPIFFREGIFCAVMICFQYFAM